MVEFINMCMSDTDKDLQKIGEEINKNMEPNGLYWIGRL